MWAPILLVFLRLCQGFGAGAEQAGATVLMAEYSPVTRRGFFAALPFIGIQAGTLLAAGVFAYLGGLPEEVLLGWAWRVPFLASIVLILIALFIRLRLKESPTFVELEKHEQVADSPMREIFSHSFGSVLARHRAADGRERRLVPVQLAGRGVRDRHHHGQQVGRPDRGRRRLLDRNASRCRWPAGCPTASAGCPSTASARWCCWCWPSRAGT